MLDESPRYEEQTPAPLACQGSPRIRAVSGRICQSRHQEPHLCSGEYGGTRRFARFERMRRRIGQPSAMPGHKLEGSMSCNRPNRAESPISRRLHAMERRKVKYERNPGGSVRDGCPPPDAGRRQTKRNPGGCPPGFQRLSDVPFLEPGASLAEEGERI